MAGRGRAQTRCRSRCGDAEEFGWVVGRDRARDAAVQKSLAGRQGFEPRFHGPEPRVLPLDDLPTRQTILAKGSTDFKQGQTTQTTQTPGPALLTGHQRESAC